VLPAAQRAHDDLAQVAAILMEMQRPIDATSRDPALLLGEPDPFAKADRLITDYGLTGCPG
jgi:hypothetical protein